MSSTCSVLREPRFSRSLSFVVCSWQWIHPAAAAAAARQLSHICSTNHRCLYICGLRSMDVVSSVCLSSSFLIPPLLFLLPHLLTLSWHLGGGLRPDARLHALRLSTNGNDEISVEEEEEDRKTIFTCFVCDLFWVKKFNGKTDWCF